MARPTNIAIAKCALLFAFLGIFLVSVTGRFSPTSRAQTAAPPAAVAKAPAQVTEKTAEQEFKNIKVLTGMPASQLGPVMNFMRASLGVNCAFCHVNNGGNWEWEKDDKRAKLAARHMIEMVIDLNKNNFGGRTAISCFTCHQGKEHPNGTPPLPQTPPEGGPGGPGAAGEKPAAETLPTADQIFDKFVQALGGKTALETAKSRVYKGTQTTGDGRVGSFEVTRATPNKMVETATFPRFAMTRGYDGAKGWMKSPEGTNELAGENLDQIRREADFNWPLNLKARFTTVQVAGKNKIGEHEVYVVVGQLSDTQRERLFFDTQSGLLLREITMTQSLVGSIPQQVDYDDYRDVGGAKWPFSVRLSLVDPWSSWTRVYAEIKPNVAVDDKQFAMPAAAKP